MKITHGTTTVHDAPINCVSRQGGKVIAHLRGCTVSFTDEERAYIASMGRKS